MLVDRKYVLKLLLLIAAVILLSFYGGRASAEAKQFTLINVLLEDTKIWLPSSVIVQEGDEVELTLINKLDAPHGFYIKAFGIEEVVQPLATITVRFTASKAGVYNFTCQMHPPHLGGQILVLSR